MSDPKISVLTTVYNREGCVGDAIESVLSSNTENWELILVDDCSSDGSYEICRKYADQDSRIRLFRNEKNLGDYGNRNMAASYASGEYLKYVDSDDVIFPYTLQLLTRFAAQFPHAGMLVAANPPDKVPPFELSSTDALLAHFTKYDLLGRAPGSALIQRHAFEAVGGFPGVRHFGDTALWLRLAAAHSVVALPFGWHWDRTLDENEKTHRLSYIKPISEQLKFELEFLKDPGVPLSESQRTAIARRLSRQARRSAIGRFVRTRKIGEIGILLNLLLRN